MTSSETALDPNDPPKYRVGMVARLTGLSTHTLRMWEKRHEAVVPARTPAGGRLYNDADVARLRRLKKLVDSGHSISGVASLDGEALMALVQGGTPNSSASPEADRVRDEFLDAIDRFDVQRAEQVLARAAAALPPREFLVEIVGPTMVEVGERWHDGRFRIVHEHVATGVLRGLLFSLSRVYPSRGLGGVVVVATPRGERHEIGALMAAILARMHGWRVVFLGTDLPAEETAFAARSSSAELLMLSMSSLSEERAREALAELAEAVPESCRLLVGGRSVPSEAGDRVEVLSNLADLDRILA